MWYRSILGGTAEGGLDLVNVREGGIYTRSWVLNFPCRYSIYAARPVLMTYQLNGLDSRSTDMPSSGTGLDSISI